MSEREELYRRAYEVYGQPMITRGVRAVVDLVLDAQPAESVGGDLMRTAGAILDMRGHAREARVARGVAEMLDAEDRAAQEKAAAEAEREKLIEQAKSVIAPHRLEHDRKQAAALVDAGWRPAPTTDGGEA